MSEIKYISFYRFEDLFARTVNCDSRISPTLEEKYGIERPGARELRELSQKSEIPEATGISRCLQAILSVKIPINKDGFEDDSLMTPQSILELLEGNPDYIKLAEVLEAYAKDVNGPQQYTTDWADNRTGGQILLTL